MCILPKTTKRSRLLIRCYNFRQLLYQLYSSREPWLTSSHLFSLAEDGTCFICHGGYMNKAHISTCPELNNQLSRPDRFRATSTPNGTTAKSRYSMNKNKLNILRVNGNLKWKFFRKLLTTFSNEWYYKNIILITLSNCMQFYSDNNGF